MNRNYYTSATFTTYDDDARLGLFANAFLAGFAAVLLLASVIAVVFIAAVTGFNYILASVIMFAFDALVMLSAVKMTKALKVWKINKQQPAIRWA